jgi:hypothetical protein
LAEPDRVRAPAGRRAGNVRDQQPADRDVLVDRRPADPGDAKAMAEAGKVLAVFTSSISMVRPIPDQIGRRTCYGAQP